MGGILEFRGRGGVSWTGILKTWGGKAVWNSKGMGGCFSSELLDRLTKNCEQNSFAEGKSASFSFV